MSTDDKKPENVMSRYTLRESSTLQRKEQSANEQCRNLMRKFSHFNKEQCKSSALEMPRLTRSAKVFPTGSRYEGQWNVLGMSGFGTYTFPYEGVKYVGNFEDGMFHGEGELQYESGVIVRGKWDQGKMVERKIIFLDGSEKDENGRWKYTSTLDRRFPIEHTDKIQAAGRSYLTANQPTCVIPPGMYDVGDGFYDPEVRVVFKYDDLTSIVRAPGPKEHEWVVCNCRKSPDGTVGPNKSIYDRWQTPTLDLDDHTTMPSGHDGLDDDDDDHRELLTTVRVEISGRKEDKVTEKESSSIEDRIIRDSNTSYELKSYIFDDNSKDNNSVKNVSI